MATESLRKHWRDNPGCNCDNCNGNDDGPQCHQITDTERWDFVERTYADVIRSCGGWRCTPASHAGTAGDTPRSAVDGAMSKEKK